MQVCVVQGDRLSLVRARYDPRTGDTTYQGQPFSTAFPTTAGFAASATWFIDNETVRLHGRRYAKYSLPRLLAPGDVRAVGEYQGVAVFGTDDPEVVYVPVHPGCEFQPYARIAPVVRDTPTRRPARPRRPRPTGVTSSRRDTTLLLEIITQAPQSDTSAPRPGLSPLDRAPARISTDPLTEIVRGGIDVTLPETMRQGKNTTVTIRIVRDPVTPGTFIVQTATGLDTPELEERRIMIRDTLSVSQVMRVRLEPGDTVGGPNFSIIPRHRDEKQSVRQGLGATWTFSVTPLRHGRQALDYTVDLLTARDTSTLDTRRRTIMVQVNRWWQLRQFTRQYILPISVTGILLPLLVFFGKRLMPEGKPAAERPARRGPRATRRKG